MAEPSLQVVVIGAGQMGAVHARAWSEVLGKHAVGLAVRHDVDRQRWDSAGFSGFQQLVGDAQWPPTVRFASVCTPTNTHVDVALPLLQRGLSTLVEKPLAGSEADGQRLLGPTDGRCFVAATCRAESTTAAGLAAVGSTPISTIVSRRAERARPLPPGTPRLAHHGRLLDVLVHDIGAVMDLLPADPPQRVAAQWDESAKELLAELRWPGFSLQITQNQAAEQSERDVHISTAGRAWGWQLSPGTRTTWQQDGDPKAERRSLAHKWRDPTEQIVIEVVAAVRDARSSPFDASNGLRVMRLAAAVMTALPDHVFGGAFDWDYVR